MLACFTAFFLIVIFNLGNSVLGEKLPEFPFPGFYGIDYVFYPSEKDPHSVLPVYFSEKYAHLAEDFEFKPNQVHESPKITPKSPVQNDYDYEYDHNVKFYLYTNKTRDKGYELIPGDIKNLQNSPFLQGKPLKILCHGWRSSYKSEEFPQAVKNKYLDHYESINVITVDWSYYIGSIGNYIRPVKHTTTCGTQLGHFIKFLVNQNYVTYDQIHFVGHSLGAHVGRALAQIVGLETIERITGLDPAGPGFLDSDNDGRLNEKCAKLVDVIHTETVYIGIEDPIGKIDFYPNGGQEQPGCPKVTWNPFHKIKDTCSHSRSHQFFLASIDPNVQFTACKCRKRDPKAVYYEPYHDFVKFQEKRCNCSSRVFMGEKLMENLHGEWENGIFFLQTDEKFPFAKALEMEIESLANKHDEF